MRKLIVYCMFLPGFSAFLNAQITSRSGNPGTWPGASPEIVPCSGAALLDEGFESGFPAGWAVIDADTLTPRPEMGLAKGWQLRADYKDSNNTVICSPSWYVNPDTSDDWLILAQFTTGANDCFSWGAYSQDAFFPESYEVRISTTTPDSAGFLANPPLFSMEEEAHDMSYHAISLSAYPSTTVYIAFRQTTWDGFVLCLDNIYRSQYLNPDAGIYAIDVTSGNPGDTLILSGVVANYGSDTLRSVDVLWSADGGSSYNMSLSGLAVAPGDTAWFVHTSDWMTDTVPHIYDFCVWTDNPNAAADANPGNDSLCQSINIGGAIGIDPVHSAGPAILVFPNPAAEMLVLEFPQEGEWAVFGIEGRQFFNGYITPGRTEIQLCDLPSGMYWLRVQSKGRMFSRTFIRQ